MSIHDEIAELHRQGRTFVLATLIKSVGSVPRDPGARMVVFPDGSIAGTIGGGEFERRVIQDGLGMFGGGANNRIAHYLLDQTGQDATGMLCGGEADVFLEVMAPPGALYIFGGGHIGQALARVALGLDFRIVVIDDRPEILAQFRPPFETILTDSTYSRNFPDIGPNGYVVIVTHGHGCDREVLARVANLDCAYIGMIGSKKKIAQTFATLEEAGIERSRLERVHAPIGIPIGAEGPHEIAIAIAAELVAVRRKKPAAE